MIHAEPLEVVLETVGLFDRIEIAALDILDQGSLEHLLVVEVHDPHRDGVQPGLLGGTEASLAGDQLISVADEPHHDGLQDAVVLDAGGQGRQLILVKGLAWLERIVLDALDGDLGTVT